jgi:HK97 family phage prohead protease
MSTDLLRRSFEFNVKAVTEDGMIEGYASVFNVIDAEGDIIAPGAFRRTIRSWQAKNRNVPVLWQHDSAMPIGVTKSMVEDENGLRVQAQLVMPVQKAQEAYALAKAGALGGMSIGFTVPRMAEDGQAAAMYDEEKGARVFREVRLWEYSMVTFPANEEAVITAVKSDPLLADLRDTLAALKKSIDEQTEFTHFLRAVRATLDAAPPVGVSESTVLSRALRQAQELLKHH